MTAPAETEFAASLERVRARTEPIVVPHSVGGVESFDGERIVREDPSRPGLQVSACHDAPAELVQRAVAASRAAQREWRRVPLQERVRRVRAALPYAEAHVADWAVRVAVEVGKPFAAAQAEGAEVVDILRFYADYAEAPGAFVDERTADPSGVASDSVLKPYGVFGVIVPFNYPIVQAAGPTIAALLAGNGVVVKTSHHAPWSGQAVAELCAAMDLPAGLVSVVHGEDEPGKALVASDVDGISFTGSVSVGQSIMRTFAAGAYPRPVIAEMGGKNPVIVTASADLEQAADGIVFSAFDLSGQKCSALSRVVVDASVHDQLVALLEQRVARLIMGDPNSADSFAGPVVSQEAASRHAALTAQARADGFRVVEGQTRGDGLLVPAVLVSGVAWSHDLATIEHFLPFLTVSPVDGFDEAMRVANATAMGLTAGIYTADPAEVDTFLDEIEAGCIDVNIPGHATTGWWPGPQTFGGWKGSGSTGKQTLGKWYVQLFARQQARKIPGSMSALLTH